MHRFSDLKMSPQEFDFNFMDSKISQCMLAAQKEVMTSNVLMHTLYLDNFEDSWKPRSAVQGSNTADLAIQS